MSDHETDFDQLMKLVHIFRRGWNRLGFYDGDVPAMRLTRDAGMRVAHLTLGSNQLIMAGQGQELMDVVEVDNTNWKQMKIAGVKLQFPAQRYKAPNGKLWWI